MNPNQKYPSDQNDDDEKKFKTFRLSSRKFGLREILTEIFLNSRLFLISLFTPITLSVFLSLLATETFVSETRLLVMVSREHMMQGPMGMMSMGGMGAETRIVRAEAEILRSHSLLENTLRALGPDNLYPEFGAIADDEGYEKALKLAVESLEEDIAIRFLPSTNVIAISYRHEEGDLAALLLNTMVSIYLEQRREIFADVGIEVLAKEIDNLDIALAEHDRQMQELRDLVQVKDFSSEQKALIRRLTTLELDQVRSRVNIEGLYAHEGELEDLIDRIPEEVSIFSQNVGVNAFNQALNNLSQLEMEQSKLIERYESGSRFIDEVNKKVLQAERNVEKLQKMNADEKGKGRNQTFDEVQQSIINTQADKSQLEAEIEARQISISDTKSRLDEFHTVETKYNQLKRQRVVMEVNYKASAIKYEQERLTKAVEANFDDSTIRVIEHATSPSEGEDKKNAIIILGLLSGIFLAASSLYISRMSRNVMVSPEEVEDTLNLPVLMTINDKRRFGKKGAKNAQSS